MNQRDERGFTPLHRAAYLAHYDGYLEIYEYLLSRGADPSIRTEDYDPYLNPGCKLPVEVATDAGDTRARLLALEAKYKAVSKAKVPHPFIGDWWTLYDYGLDAVRQWKPDYRHPFPEDLKRAAEEKERKAAKAARRKAKAEAAKAGVSVAAAPKKAAPTGPTAFLFPGRALRLWACSRSPRTCLRSERCWTPPKRCWATICWSCV